MRRIFFEQGLISRGETTNMTAYSRYLAAAWILTLLGACGETDTNTEPPPPAGGEKTAQPAPDQRVPASPAEAVSARALARWDALVAGDYKKAHAFISPGMRSLLPLDYYRAYLEASALHWKAAEVESVECAAQRCEAAIRRTDVYVGSITALVGQETSSKLQESWIQSEGEWWFVPRR